MGRVSAMRRYLVADRLRLGCRSVISAATEFKFYERSRLNAIRSQSAYLAAKLFEAKQSANTIKIQQFENELEAYCTKHHLDIKTIIEGDLNSRASNLVVKWLSRIRSKKTKALIARMKYSDSFASTII